MKRLYVIIIFAALFFFANFLFSSNQSTKNIKPVNGLEISLFLGKWYEIARLPVFFEEGLTHVTATYTLKPDGNIEVLNEGIKKGKPSSIKGRAWIPDPQVPSKLLVSFFLWFASDYIVFDLDTENYRYAMVTSGTKDYLWILCREPEMEEEIYQKLLAHAEAEGFILEKLYKVPQD